MLVRESTCTTMEPPCKVTHLVETTHVEGRLPFLLRCKDLLEV